MVGRRDDNPAWVRQADELLAKMVENNKLERELLSRASDKSYTNWLEDRLRLQQQENQRLRSILNLIYMEFSKGDSSKELTRLLTNLAKNNNLEELGINYDLRRR